MEWSRLLEQLGSGQTKTKLTALEQLQTRVQAAPLSRDNVSSLLDLTPQLLNDNNFKVALKLLNCWETIAANSRDVVKPYVNSLMPPVVDRLGDNRQDVRQAACNLLLELLQVLRPDVMMEKLGRFWAHKNWKVRHGLLQFVAEAISTTGEAALVPPRDEGAWVLHRVIQLVGDPESAVRDASIECLEEVYRVYGEALVDIISSHQLRPAHLSTIYTRLAAMGANVAPSRSTSSAGGGAGLGEQQQQQGGQQQADSAYAGAAAREEFDTATSTAGDSSFAPAEADVAAARPAAANHRRSSSAGSAAAAQQQQQRPPPAEEAGAGGLEAGKSWGSNLTAGAVAAATSAAPKAKRGGYKDGGGITSDGGLPPVQAIVVASERELAGEMERITEFLNKGVAVDWEKRVSALVRLEGLVKGGAAGSYEVCFLEHLRVLKDPLLDQMIDRRSAVARQAAHLFHVLAAALGMRFEPYAVTFMAHLYKGLVITVQVVSEASDAGAKGILRHCRAHKLVAQVCDIMTADKSAKLRKHCSAYLLQVLEEWEVHEYAHHLDALEAAIAAAAQDALGETRTNGRTAFAAYAAALPERAAALLRRFDAGLQAKLQEAVLEYGRGGHTVVAHVKTRSKQPPPSKPWKAGPGSSTAGSEPEIVIVTAPPAGSQRPPRGGSTRVVSGGGGSGSQAAPPRSAGGGPVAPEGVGLQQHLPPSVAGTAAAGAGAATALPARNSRKSVAGVPMRVPGGGGAGPLPLLGPSEGGSSGGGAEAGSASAAAAPGRGRRTSMMPQRVPYHGGDDARLGMQGPMGRLAVPGGADGGAAAGFGMQGGGGFGASMAPDSPESYARSDASGVGDGGAAVGLEHRGVAATRLFQAHTAKQAPQHQQAPGHASLARKAPAAPGGDDLQMQLLLRDQLAAAATQQQYAQQQYTQQQYVHDRAGSSLSMASAGPSGVQGPLGGPHGLMVGSQPAKPASLSKVVAGVLAAAQDWKERVDRMNALGHALARQVELDARPEAFVEVERVVPKLMAAMDDAHFKVSLAALSLLQVCINTCPYVLESSLDKLMPLLFLKLCGTKQSVRSAAEAALQGCALELDADVLMPALTRSLEVMKQPAARVSVMEFVVLFMGLGRIAGTPTNVAHIRQWNARNIPLLLDKNPNVRQMAGRALSTMYGVDPHSVAACLQHASPQEVHAVQRSLTEAEAAAAAEHGMAAAAEQDAVDAAAHAAAWVHQTAVGHAPSVSSSTDLSHEQYNQGHMDAGPGSGTQQGAGAQACTTSGQAVQGLAAGLSELALAPPQHQYQQQQGSALYGADADVQHLSQQQPYIGGQQQQQPQQQSRQVTAAPVDAGGSQQGAARDVLGRSLLPGDAAAADAATPAAAAAGKHLQPHQQQQQQATPAAAGPPASPATHSAAAAAAAAAAVAAGDASSQARHLTVLVHRLQSRPADDVLAELTACAGLLCRQAWQDNFSKVLLAGLSAAQASSDSVRELAFLLVLALAQHHGRLFEPVLDVVLQPLLQGCADSSREVLVAAQQALDVLMAEMPPQQCSDILSHKLPSEAATLSGTAVDGEVLCATVRCLQAVSRRMSGPELMAVAPQQLLPGLFAAFQHPRPDVRKIVVFCLVDMWHTAGDKLTPYLASLSTSQLKLLTIYYNRAQQGQQQLDA